MTIEKLADYLYISKQLNPRFAKQIASYNIKTVICNRPDGEEPNQPTFEQIKEFLTEIGVEKVIYQPITTDTLDDLALEEFQHIVAQSPSPILAYCRTGTRSTLLWALNQAKRGVEVNSLIKAAELININLTPYREKLESAYRKK